MHGNFTAIFRHVTAGQVATAVKVFAESNSGRILEVPGAYWHRRLDGKTRNGIVIPSQEVIFVCLVNDFVPRFSPATKNGTYLFHYIELL
jgi:hypothetical protein